MKPSISNFFACPEKDNKAGEGSEERAEEQLKDLGVFSLEKRSFRGGRLTPDKSLTGGWSELRVGLSPQEQGTRQEESASRGGRSWS